MLPSLTATIRIDSPLPVAEAREILARNLDEYAAALGGYGTGKLPFHGRIEGDAILLRRVHVRPSRTMNPALRARLDALPEGGSRLAGTIGADSALAFLAVLAVLVVAVALWTGAIGVALVGGLGVAFAGQLMRRGAEREAETMRALLEPLLREPFTCPR